MCISIVTRGYENLLHLAELTLTVAWKVIYKAVVIAKILHAIPAWWGFTAASDRQKLDAFLRRGARLKFYSHDEPSIAELVDETKSGICTSLKSANYFRFL